MALIQRANLDGAEQIELTEPIITVLTAGLRDDMVAPQRVELGVEVHAASAEEIDRGRFELWVTATPRANSSMAGRFAYLLDEPDRVRLAATYTSGDDDAIAAQLSFPPRRAHNENVVRVPALLPDVLALSEHPTGHGLSVDDLAVTADAEHLYLVQRSTGRRVIPRVLHALDAYQQTPPLARFLAEVADARCAVYGPFDFGAARALPYTPRIRYRRTVLAPARWILAGADLGLSRLDAPSGDAAIRAWLQRWRVPDRVLLCEGELRLPLDLTQPLERTLLRTRLQRAGRVELRETGSPDARTAGSDAQLLIPLTLHTPPTRRPPVVTLRPELVSYPGAGEVMHAHLVGNPVRFDEILTSHLPRLVTNLAGDVVHWWAGRYRNTITPDADQYLTIYLRLSAPDRSPPG